MDVNPKSSGNRIFTTDSLLAFIYLFTNILFIWKYGIEYYGPAWIIPIIYAVIICALIFAPLDKIKLRLSVKAQAIIYFSFVALTAIGLTFLMTRFDPANIGCARFPAMLDWISNLFSGKYPYAPGAFTSGFPFLFISALPFYLLGDIGLYQIFSFIVFAAIIFYKHYGQFIAKLKMLLLLIASPLFMYEVVVRSELFSNMVIILLYLTILQSIFSRKGKAACVILGFIGGLLLSTRGIVLLIYIIFLGSMFRQYHYNYRVFLISLVAGFGLTLLPFMLWNWDCFIDCGPFTVQMWYCPKWLLALSIVASIVCGMSLKSSAKIFFTISVLLFSIVTVSFAIRILEFGFKDTVLQNFYDISYYCLAQPFLLLSFGLAAKARPVK